MCKLTRAYEHDATGDTSHTTTSTPFTCTQHQLNKNSPLFDEDVQVGFVTYVDVLDGRSWTSGCIPGYESRYDLIVIRTCGLAICHQIVREN